MGVVCEKWFLVHRRRWEKRVGGLERAGLGGRTDVAWRGMLPLGSSSLASGVAWPNVVLFPVVGLVVVVVVVLVEAVVIGKENEVAWLRRWRFWLFCPVRGGLSSGLSSSWCNGYLSCKGEDAFLDRRERSRFPRIRHHITYTYLLMDTVNEVV